MEMHVLLANRRYEMLRHQEREEVALIVVYPRIDPCLWITAPADRIQKSAVFLVVPSPAAHAGPGEIDNVDRGIRRHLGPATCAAGIANTPLVVFGMML